MVPGAAEMPAGRPRSRIFDLTIDNLFDGRLYYNVNVFFLFLLHRVQWEIVASTLV